MRGKEKIHNALQFYFEDLLFKWCQPEPVEGGLQ